LHNLDKESMHNFILVDITLQNNYEMLCWIKESCFLNYYLMNSFLLFFNNYNFIFNQLNTSIINNYNFIFNQLNTSIINYSCYYFNLFINFTFSSFKNNIFNYFFEYTHTTITYKSYNFTDTKYKYTTCCLIKHEYRILPLGFFIPNAILLEPAYWKVFKINLSYSEFTSSNYNDYFSNLSNPLNLQHFIEIWMVYELNKNYNYENNLSNITNYINNIDNRALKLKSLEYQRYNNYVLKHKSYKDILNK
jgi:hypothetical protein